MGWSGRLPYGCVCQGLVSTSFQSPDDWPITAVLHIVMCKLYTWSVVTILKCVLVNQPDVLPAKHRNM